MRHCALKQPVESECRIDEVVTAPESDPEITEWN